jgi:hypothetical protein
VDVNGARFFQHFVLAFILQTWHGNQTNKKCDEPFLATKILGLIRRAPNQDQDIKIHFRQKLNPSKTEFTCTALLSTYIKVPASYVCLIEKLPAKPVR